MAQIFNGSPSSGTAAGATAFSSSFPEIPNPNPDGTYQVTVSLQSSPAGPEKAIVALYQGTTRIAYAGVTINTSPQNVTLTLSAGQVQQLQRSQCQLSGLSVKVEQAESAICTEDPLPQQLFASLELLSNFEECTCLLDGASGTLNWNPTTRQYEGALSFCDQQWDLQLYCDGDTCDDWMLVASGCSPSVAEHVRFLCSSGSPSGSIVIGRNIFGCCGTGPTAARLTIG